MAAGGLDAAIAAAASAKEPTKVEFGGFTVRVKPLMQWRNSAMDAINTGRFNQWAMAALVNDYVPAKGNRKASGSNDGQVFVDADLTLQEVVEFFAAYSAATGQSPGE